MRFAILVVLLLVGPARADGPCCPFGVRHATPLDLFEEATTVARIEITSTAPVAWKTITTFKGSAPAQFLARERAMSECEPDFTTGEAIVFLDHESRFVGGFAYHGYKANPSAELVALVAAWSTSTDRPALLVQTIEKASPELAEHAVRFLADSPATLNAITSEQRDRIAAAVARLADHSYAPFLLVRLRANIATSIPKRMGLRKRALQLAQHDFESASKRELVAAIVAVRIGSSARGSAAFERCERLHGKRLLTFEAPLSHVHGEDSPMWRRMVRSCAAD